MNASKTIKGIGEEVDGIIRDFKNPKEIKSKPKLGPKPQQKTKGKAPKKTI